MVKELGPPTSYLALEEGAKVYASDGEPVGRVVEVRADETADIFDGIVIVKGLLPTSGSHHFVAADRVEEIYERGVLLELSSAQVDALPSHPES